MSRFSQFREQVRDALNHLYDYAYLASHPLAMRFWPEKGVEISSRAQSLHRLLLETIEELHPAADSCKDVGSYARSYALLAYRYVEGWEREEIMQELACSRRQFFREQQKALALLATKLWDKLPREYPPLSDIGDPLATEAGRVLVQWETVEPGEIAQGVLRAAIPLAERHGVTLECELEPDLPLISANRTLLRQALLNALSDLSTRPGTQRVTLRMGCCSPGVVVELDVRPALDDDLPALEPARRLVEMMGGEWQSDGGNMGCACQFVLPAAAPSSILLVVEDNDAVVRAFRRYLAGHGYQVSGASSLPEALHLARDLHPAAITLDVMMPNQDGWEILQALKNDPQTRGIPVIVCSALNDPDLAQSLGAVACLRKPISQADLLAALASLPPSSRPRR